MCPIQGHIKMWWGHPGYPWSLMPRRTLLSDAQMERLKDAFCPGCDTILNLLLLLCCSEVSTHSLIHAQPMVYHWARSPHSLNFYFETTPIQLSLLALNLLCSLNRPWICSPSVSASWGKDERLLPPGPTTVWVADCIKWMAHDPSRFVNGHHFQSLALNKRLGL